MDHSQVEARAFSGIVLYIVFRFGIITTPNGNLCLLLYLFTYPGDPSGG